MYDLPHADSHENHKCSRALTASTLCRNSAKSENKCIKYNQEFINAPHQNNTLLSACLNDTNNHSANVCGHLTYRKASKSDET